jgi:hypothetical protein
MLKASSSKSLILSFTLNIITSPFTGESHMAREIGWVSLIKVSEGAIASV